MTQRHSKQLATKTYDNFTKVKSMRFTFLSLVVLCATLSMGNAAFFIPLSGVRAQFDSIVGAFGSPLTDGITYNAYLTLPPKSLDSEKSTYSFLCGSYDNKNNQTDSNDGGSRQRHSSTTTQQANTSDVVDEDEVYRALLVRDGGCSYEEKWKNAMYVDQYILADTVASVIDRLEIKNSIRYLILYDSDSESDNITLVDNNGVSSSSLFLKLNGTFVFVSPQTGNNLFLLLRNRFLYSKWMDPNFRGLYIQLDSRRIDDLPRSNFFDAYSLIFGFFASLMVFTMFTQWWGMRLQRARRNLQESTNNQATTPTVVPKEQVSALPLIQYHHHKQCEHVPISSSSSSDNTKEQSTISIGELESSGDYMDRLENHISQMENSNDEEQVPRNDKIAFQTSMCHICLEDFEQGDYLRKLPCRHVFHPDCIDVWLTERQDYCPVCKAPAVVL